MDPAGIREIHLLRPYLDNPYQIESICRALPYKTRVHAVYGLNPWFPFSELLTQRVSRASEGYAGWMQYDCTVIAGVDLESAAERDVQNLKSALERGLPVLLCGGGFGLGNSYRLWHDFEPYLPARVPAAKPVPCGKTVTGGSHPLLRGLPREFGVVGQVHPLELQDGAQVVLQAGDQPVLVASERAGGRQLILAVAQADGLCCDALRPEGFYGHPFYPDLIRRCLSWLMGVETPLWIEGLTVQHGSPGGSPSKSIRSRREGEAPAEPLTIRASVKQPAPVPGALLRCSVFAVDEARIASGGDTRRADKLSEVERPIRSTDQTETFALEDALGGKCSGVYEVELALEMPEPPRALPKDSFAMAQPPRWNNWKGKAVDVRRFYVRFPDRRTTLVAIPNRICALQEGRPWRVTARADDLHKVKLEIRDAAGQTVGQVTAKGGPVAELAWTPPALTDGDYVAHLDVERAGNVREQFAFALKTATLPPADDGFPMVSHSSTGTLNDDEIAELHRVTLAEFGLDTLSHGVLRHAEAIQDPAARWTDQPFPVRRTLWTQAMATAAGRYLWDDFDARLIVLSTHGVGKPYAPTVPCVHHPDYEAAVRRELEPRLRLLAAQAGMISAEIIDEPHLHASNLCRCEICQRRYRERFGEDLPGYEAVEGDQTARRWHLFEWLEDYTTRAFAAAYRLKQELAPKVHVHNTAIDRLFTSNFMFNGMHRWAAHGDELYMACYPWSYANWRGYRQMPHSQTHWIAGYIRSLARHHGIPWGVFMELWEHDAPNRWLPEYWSVGQFYTLLAEGVDRLDTFLVAFDIEYFAIGWDRLREFGREINKVRPFFPLLPRSTRPKGRLAFINPWAEWVMNPLPHYLPPDHEGYGYYRRYKLPFDKLYPSENRRMLAYELFHRVFTDLDQVDEQLLGDAVSSTGDAVPEPGRRVPPVSGPPLDYQAIVLCDCTFLMRRTAQQLRDFVKQGGVLVLDSVPRRDEHGRDLDLLASLLKAPVETGIVVPGLEYQLFKAGRGRIALFSASLQTAYADAVENERSGIQDRLEQTVKRVLKDLGLKSRITSSNGAIAAGLRLSEGSVLVPVSNTSDARQTVRIAIRELPFDPVLAVNLTDGADIKLVKTRGAVAFDVALESHRGALCVLYASEPSALAITVSPKTCRQGEDLRLTISLMAGRKRAAGTFVIETVATDGNGRVHRRLSSPLVVTGGRLQVTRRIPVNAPPGRWRIRLQEPIIGLQAQAEFVVVVR